MGYGERIRQWRGARGWTQQHLSAQLGCTDSYVTHLENEVKVPSLDICLALAEVFQLTPQEQHAFLEEVEATRRQRTETRIRTRGSVVRGAIQRRGLLPTSPAPTVGDTHPAPTSEAMDPQSIAHDLARDPDLQAAYRDLKIALADPRLREPVLNALRAFTQLARSGS